MPNRVKSEATKTWWQGNSTRMWRLTTITVFLALASWTLVKITEFPEKYICKTDFIRAVERIEGKIDKINDNLLEVIKNERQPRR